MKKVILFELNEVPFKVIDRYVAEKPNSCIAKVLRRGRSFDCLNADVVQLDPWIAWPTLHRGVTDEQHGIFHLGQSTAEKDKEYPPIWQIVKQYTPSVGVFGSLTSSTVPVDAGTYAFYIPDYFSEEAFANPPSLLPFQSLNLLLTRESGRNVSKKLPATAALEFLKSAPNVGISYNTIKQTVKQIVGETLNNDIKTRRRSIQPLLMLDLFLHQAARQKPTFATFYTNHVAAAMHRYWAAYFPQDYAAGQGMPQAWVDRFAGEIPAAMDRLDEMLVKLTAFVDTNEEYSLVIASAIGQAAIPTEEVKSFVTVIDSTRFLSKVRLSHGGPLRQLPAMVPCISVVVSTDEIVPLRESLRTVRINGCPMIEDHRPIAPLSFDVNDTGTVHIFVQWDDYPGEDEVEINGRRFSFEEAGFGVMQHEDGVNCSAQHVRAGSLIVYDHQQREPGRETIESTEIAPNILGRLGIPVPPYMAQTVDIF